MPRNPRRKPEESGGAPAWLVTYGDLMSLLLTFFVLLLSFSTISERDFRRAMMSLQGAFGVLQYQDSAIRPITVTPRQASREMERIARKLRRALQIRGLEDQVRIEFDAAGGFKLSLPDAILFDSASADLKPAAAPILDDVAEILAELPETFLEVRGHTDSRPLTSTARYRDNWDLSYFRADAVARYLNRAGNIPMRQFEVVACGESQPVATNDTEEGRAANRRVEVYVRGVLDRGRIEDLRREFRRFDLMTQPLAAPPPPGP